MIKSQQFDFKVWLQAMRAFSFTASIIPVLIGAAWALQTTYPVRWGVLPLFVLSALLIHAGTNLISDYYDFKKGVDKDYTFGSSGVLTSDQLTPEQIKKGAWLMFGLAFVIGLGIVFLRGWPIFILGVLGIMAGWFYTANPVGYKYVGFGDLFVALFMGVLLVMGSHFALTGIMDLTALWISLPISLLVIAILHGNNVRDIQHDAEAGIKTMAIALGHRKSQYYYYALVAGAYILVGIMIVSGLLSGWSCLVALSFPLAFRNIKMMRSSVPDQPKDIAMMDIVTAQLHLAFGLLFIGSICLGAVFS